MRLIIAALLCCFVHVCAEVDVALNTFNETPNKSRDVAAAHVTRMKRRYPEELLLPHGLNARPITGMLRFYRTNNYTSNL
jgi:hypothetical protein